MKVEIYSREAIVNLLLSDFPNNVAVISFYDYTGDCKGSGYAPVDYSVRTDRVFKIELRDLDFEILSIYNFTYETYFPEADDLAKFIYDAHSDGLDIICQCEYGKSRSAGCAAAICEHFYQSGLSVFTDFRYYPNQLVFNKVLESLEKHKAGENPLYYCISEEYISSLLSKIDGGDELFSALSFKDKANCVRSKQKIEALLSSENLLCRSWWEAVEGFLKENPIDFISAKLSDVECYFDKFTWRTSAFGSTYKYCCKKIEILFYYLLLTDDRKRKREQKKAKRKKGYEPRYRGTTIENTGATEFALLAKMIWDDKNDRIILIPVIISDVRNAGKF